MLSLSFWSLHSKLNANSVMWIRTTCLLHVVVSLSELVRCMETELCFPVVLDTRQQYNDNDVETLRSKCVLRIRAFHQELEVDLRQDSNFIGSYVPGRDAPWLTAADVTIDLSGCFYSGSVNGDRYSYAALSLCKGVQGALGYQGWEYFINPVRNDTSSAGSAHVIRRRHNSDLQPNSTSRCAVNNDIGFHHAHVLGKYKSAKDNGNVTTSALRRMGRSKRFASVPRYVETLLVADQTMAEFHGDDLKHYLLTLMSVAARLYKHPSILNSINIVVVKIVVLSEVDKGPKVSGNAAMTLRNFCTWQKKMNKNNDKHAEYWDTAILFTRQDLCGASTCDTLGMADVGTMCDPKRSCSVIEDDGLPSAFTTAHELGHVFNMPHDNVKACEDVFGKLQDNHMMSPTLIQINRTSPWSPCSAAIVTDFLDNGHGECLLDQPQKPLSLPNALPGVSYILERQCELAFGEGSKPCPFMQPPCIRLWCTGKSNGQLVCMTRHFPWADGTHCGDGKVCDRGVCSPKEDRTFKVDGRWGKWGSFGLCSRTCGGGVQLAKRECNNPVPSNGGKYCQGVRVKYRSCSLNHCPDTGKTYRDEQCESSGRSFSSNHIAPSVVWVPKYSGVSVEDRCKLICRANGTGYFYVMAPKVVDGTPCSPDSTGVCVQGKCIKAGCDGKIGSTKKFNKCGVCGGDNKSCKKVSGLFTKPMHGYNFVVMLPVGATNIDIRQRGYQGMLGDDNYLAVKNSEGHYLLNGDYVVSAGERDIIVKGSLLRYSGTTGLSETLQSVNPLGETLTVEVLCAGNLTPPRIRYSFYLARQNNKEDKALKKEDREKSHNSVLAHDSAKERGAATLKKPYSKEQPLLEKWTSASWDTCSVSCGNGFQRRMVQCLRTDGKPGLKCDPTKRPSATRACGDPCPEWNAGQWSPCSTTCGKGFKRRPLHCKAQTGHLLPRDHCSGLRKPQELDFCKLKPC
ncbi:A disintegrin and metalloproteinase with thrombospondin motifs 15-like [Syngnathoides biaculeatus]|uniref:A disintegrin and metalloproteinase with thrombospondin motifs 15-like n=1 Tax=Syngnathoides biaculeatus TaxID=300417 RepID=UPI002ADE73B8|nr:A disintegrin and metalloproteinase with thrombospondin motifs 15-like [Syngnathoides biaculeatus]